MGAPRAKNGSTKTVRPASVTNTGDSPPANTRQSRSAGGREGSVAATRRPSTKFHRGNNPGVSVGNGGNAHGNAAMGGFPHKGVPSTGGRRANITKPPAC